MRPATPFFAFAAAALITAGCTGGSTTGGIPAVGPNPSSATPRAAVPNHGGPCPDHGGGCKPQLIAPLNFDGTTFTIATFRSCDHVRESKAPEYTAPSSGPLTLSGNVSLPPTCVPATLPSSQLFIVGEQTHRHGGGGGNLSPNGKMSFTTIAGPVNWTDNPWSFAAVSPGLALQANANYIFFVESVPISATPSPQPSPTEPPNNEFHAIVPLSFDGTNFTVATVTSCDDFGSAPAYTATASGPLQLQSDVLVTPTCAPSPEPSDAPQTLYIVASTEHGGNQGDAMRPNHRGGKSIHGTAIAGPVSATDNPWTFAPLVPVTLTAGTNYTFFVAYPKGHGRN
jgi:hypothetical protein